MEKSGCTVVETRSRAGLLDISTIIEHLGKLGTARILLEAGPRLISAFLTERLIDELIVYQSPAIAADGRARQLMGNDTREVGDFISGFQYRQTRRVGDDVMMVLWRT